MSAEAVSVGRGRIGSMGDGGGEGKEGEKCVPNVLLLAFSY